MGGMKHSKEVYDFWQRIKRETGIEGDFTDVWGFGGTSEVKQELLDLILEGRKRASTNLLRESELAGYPPSEVGQYNIVLDGNDKPAAVIKTVSLRRARFNEVDEEHAYWEGEGDRTVETYLEEHIKYYNRVGEVLGFEFREDMEVEFERFELVYPVQAHKKGRHFDQFKITHTRSGEFNN